MHGYNKSFTTKISKINEWEDEKEGTL